MKYFILTNNPQAAAEFEATHEVRFTEGGLKDVLIAARDLINSGAILLSHPLYGSVKPNETPYRSLLIRPGKTSGTGDIPPADIESVMLIENAISTAGKFTDKKEITDPKLLEDFQAVDLSLLRSAVASADQ